MSSNGIEKSNPLPNRLLRLPDVVRYTGLSRSSIYALQGEGKFPKSVKLSLRAVAWPQQQIQKWIEGREVGGAV
ncbi:MAG: AlpA family phage regulatory protein [Burkholderiaceae bacterium]|nr:AlpA family phage regulatory protein [Burkholderiaceae bacterium]